MALNVSWNTPVKPFGTVGWSGQDQARMINASGGAVVPGDILAVDTTVAPVNGLWTTMKKVATGDLDLASFAICISSAADDGEVDVVFRAQDVDILNGTGGATAIAAGAALAGKNDSYGVIATAAATKVLGYAHAAIADAATGSCTFNGVEGFANNNA